MKIHRPALGFAAMAVAASLVLAACGGGGAADSGVKKADTSALPTKVPAGTKLVFGEYPNQTAILLKESGYAKKLKEDVKYAVFPGYLPDVIEAMRAGKVDISANADIGPALARAQGVGVVGVSAITGGNTLPGLFVSPKNGKITKVSQLKGKKVAIAGATSAGLWVLLALDKAGLSPKDVKLVNMGLNDVPAALKKNQVDAGLLNEPVKTKTALALKGTGFHELTDIGDFGSELQVLYVSQKSLADPAKAAAIRDYVYNFVKANLWKKDHLHEFNEVQNVKLNGFDEATAKILEDATSYRHFKVNRIDDTLTARLQKYIDLFVELGYLKKGSTAKGSFDPRFDAVQQQAVADYDKEKKK